MKKIIATIVTGAVMFIPTLAFAGLLEDYGLTFGAGGGIETMDQWKATTTPDTAITQRVFGKPVKISGLLDGCLSLNSGIATTSGAACGSGSGSGGVGTSTNPFMATYFVATGTGSGYVAEVGSVSNPAYTFSTDLDTGFFSSGSNNVNVAAGGAEIMRWVSNMIQTNQPMTGNADDSYYVTNTTGTVSAPAYAFGGDTDTGIYTPINNTISFTAGGTEVLRSDVASTTILQGNFGIGTSSPYAKLSVAGEVVGEYFTATSTTATSTIAGGLTVDGNTLVVDYELNRVGIAGSPSVTSGTSLRATGSIDATTGYRIGGSTFVSVGTGTFLSLNHAGGVQIVDTNNGSRILFRVVDGSGANEGYVGIGTTSPFAKLSIGGGNIHVGGIITSTSTTAASTFPYASTTAISIAGLTSGRIPVASTGGLLRDYAALTFDGTNLKVEGNAEIGVVGEGNLSIRDSGGGTVIYLSGNASDSYFNNPDGNVGIRTTTPSVPLEVVGNVRVTSTGNSGYYMTMQSNFSTSDSINFFDRLSNAFLQHDLNTGTDYITTLGISTGRTILNGSVGVGSTSPFYKLSVEGDASFANNVRANYFTATSTTATSTFQTGIRMPGIKSANTAEIYNITDVNNASLDATYIVPGSSGNRVIIGTAAKPVYSLNIANATNGIEGLTNLSASGYVGAGSGTFYLTNSTGNVANTTSYYGTFIRTNMAGAITTNTVGHLYGAGANAYGLAVQSSRTDTVTLVVGGQTSQTADLQQWRTGSAASGLLANIGINGYFGLGTSSPMSMLAVAGTITANTVNATSTTATSTFSGGFRLSKQYTPPASASTCTVGDFAWDADYFYICTATDVWERSAHATW